MIYTPILIQYNMKTSGMKNLYQRDMNLEEVEETEETSDEDEVFSDIDLDEETQSKLEAMLDQQISSVLTKI